MCAGRGCSSTRHILSGRRGFGLLLRSDKLLCRGIVISYGLRNENHLKQTLHNGHKGIYYINNH